MEAPAESSQNCKNRNSVLSASPKEERRRPMALYHFSVKIISRANGQSACAASAYRSGEKIQNDRDGITHDYRKKQNVEYAVVMLPENAPAIYADREALWNAVEKAEKQSNAQLAREFEFALPRELPFEERKRIAIDFIQEQFVSEGMIVDVAFHNPPKMNSKKQPIDEDGNVTHDPYKYIYENPHVHAMCTMRPLDETGKWEAKKQKLYVCEKDGRQKSFSSQTLKENPGWEKLYNYQSPSGNKAWHTKSYVEDHPEENLTLVNRYPKCEQVINPKVEKWNSSDTLLMWREAWAVKVNEAYESLGMEERIDHRSYKDQGVDLIPTVHEGKAVTIAEKRLKEEYEQKIARGEEAILQHTEIRDLNIAIREHNRELRIIAEMKKLRAQLEKIIAPIKERIEAAAQSIAEKLERLRVSIVTLGMKIHRAVDTKAQDDEQIAQNQAYIKDLAPIRKERLDELRQERKTLKSQLDSTTGLFSGKKREDLQERLDRLDAEIDLQKENRKYALTAQKEIDHLKEASEKAGKQINIMQEQRVEKIATYTEIVSQIPEDQIEVIRQERLTLRPDIEKEGVARDEIVEFHLEAEKIDEKMEGHERRIKISF